MGTENFYVGGQEYYIIYQNGTHYVKRVEPDCYLENTIVYQGHYEACLKYQKDLEVAYEESKF